MVWGGAGYIQHITGCQPSTRRCADLPPVCLRRLAAILKVLQLPVYPLHAQMEQQQRLKYFDRFKADG